MIEQMRAWAGTEVATTARQDSERVRSVLRRCTGYETKMSDGPAAGIEGCRGDGITHWLPGIQRWRLELAVRRCRSSRRRKMSFPVS